MWRLGRTGLSIMWCQLGMQILLVSTTVLVVGKPAMVQLIAGLIEISSLGRCSIQTTLDTLQNNSLRNSWHSCPSRQTRLQLKTVKIWDFWICSAGYRLQVAFCWVNFVKFIFHNIYFSRVLCPMHWKSCASRSALPSSSPGRKRNKIHAVSAGNQKSKELQRAWSGGKWFIRFHGGFFISGFPVLMGYQLPC